VTAEAVSTRSPGAQGSAVARHSSRTVWAGVEREV